MSPKNLASALVAALVTNAAARGEQRGNALESNSLTEKYSMKHDHGTTSLEDAIDKLGSKLVDRMLTRWPIYHTDQSNAMLTKIHPACSHGPPNINFLAKTQPASKRHVGPCTSLPYRLPSSILRSHFSVSWSPYSIRHNLPTSHTDAVAPGASEYPIPAKGEALETKGTLSQFKDFFIKQYLSIALTIKYLFEYLYGYFNAIKYLFNQAAAAIKKWKEKYITKIAQT